METNKLKIKTIYDPRYTKILQLLVAARLNAGISQKELALLLKLNQSDVSKIEHCQRRIDITEFLDWLRITKTDVKEFIDKLLVNYD